ncbi:MAG: T9SS type A sorting domain-containing protein [Flavobacteriales bacterium]|nr:T9SS type A sorting domain-containing protein [Flavobacteriales bacterium]
MLSSILFLDADNILVSGVEGTILKTENGGNVGITDITNQPQLKHHYDVDQNILSIIGISDNNQYQLSLVDVLGKQVIYDQIRAGNATVNLTNLQSGIYIFNVYSGEESYSGKLIK